jgi:hypothetical protein
MSSRIIIDEIIRIVYVDGAYKNPAVDRPKYVASDECWMGKIDHHDPKKIQWSKLPSHPGTAVYRIATGGSEKDQKSNPDPLLRETARTANCAWGLWSRRAENGDPGPPRQPQAALFLGRC